ncbi:hypothetical protein FPQ18DRAFT_397500 [Pyronema domesticum]|nr:hypothetical protein FPQ18DRAFT_397500 [Pyronema domesticum]
MGTRRNRLRREALLTREEDGTGQFGQERPEDRANQQEWERDRDQESLFEWTDKERGGEEDIAGEGEAGDAIDAEQNCYSIERLIRKARL